MRHAHFLVLTGRLNEFPLHELIETLRGQRKTGRLLIEFAAGPCSLYFREGALIDASLGTLRGLEALSLALSLQQEEAAPFNFNPLVAPPDAPAANANVAQTQSDNSTTIFAREAATHSRAQVIEVEAETSAHETTERVTTGALNAAHAGDDAARPRALLPAAEEGTLVERLARIETVVSAQARRANVERAVYAVVIIMLIVVAFLWRGGDATQADHLRAATDRPPTTAAPASTTAPASQTTATDAATLPAESLTETQTAPSPDSTNALSTVADAQSAASVTRPPIKPDARLSDPRARRLSSTDAAATQARPVQPQTTAPAPRPAQGASDATARGAAGGAERAVNHVVQVRMTIERGRVLRAEVSNPRPGMAAYEALALRMARQRRYPEEFSGQETLRLAVGQ